MAPVEGSMDRPGVELKVPPACPVRMTGAEPEAQKDAETEYGLLEYRMLAEASATTVTVAVELLLHDPLDQL